MIHIRKRVAVLVLSSTVIVVAGCSSGGVGALARSSKSAARSTQQSAADTTTPADTTPSTPTSGDDTTTTTTTHYPACLSVSTVIAALTPDALRTGGATGLKLSSNLGSQAQTCYYAGLPEDAASIAGGVSISIQWAAESQSGFESDVSPDPSGARKVGVFDGVALYELILNTENDGDTGAEIEGWKKGIRVDVQCVFGTDAQIILLTRAALNKVG